MKSAVLRAESEAAIRVAERVIAETGADGVYISWHEGHRESHDFGGKVYTLAEYRNTILPKLREWNCYHRPYPVVMAEFDITTMPGYAEMIAAREAQKHMTEVSRSFGDLRVLAERMERLIAEHRRAKSRELLYVSTLNFIALYYERKNIEALEAELKELGVRIERAGTSAWDEFKSGIKKLGSAVVNGVQTAACFGAGLLNGAVNAVTFRFFEGITDLSGIIPEDKLAAFYVGRVGGAGLVGLTLTLIATGASGGMLTGGAGEVAIALTAVEAAGLVAVLAGNGSAVLEVWDSSVKLAETTGGGFGSKKSGKNTEDISDKLTRAQKRNVDTLDNIIENNLTDADFSGTLSDLQGNPIPKADGGYWDHLTEMKQSLRGLQGVKNGLEGSLQNPNLLPEVRGFLQQNLDKANYYISKIENLFKSFGG